MPTQIWRHTSENQTPSLLSLKFHNFTLEDGNTQTGVKFLKKKINHKLKQIVSNKQNDQNSKDLKLSFKTNNKRKWKEK